MADASHAASGRRTVWAASVDRIRQGAQRFRKLLVPNLVENGAPVLRAVENARSREDREVPRDDRQVDGSAFRELTDRARPPAFRKASDKEQPSRIGERLEELREKEIVDRGSRTRGGFGSGRSSFLAHLRHRASIGCDVAVVKRDFLAELSFA